MNVCIVGYSRVGGTTLGHWLSRELDMIYVHEPFNPRVPAYKDDTDFSANHFLIKVHTDELDLVEGEKIKIGLIRENTFDCAISILSANQTNRWHLPYIVDEGWINSNREELETLSLNLQNTNLRMREMKWDLFLTYEGIYERGEDLQKIKEFFAIEEFQWKDLYINQNLRYRNQIQKII